MFHQAVELQKIIKFLPGCHLLLELESGKGEGDLQRNVFPENINSFLEPNIGGFLPSANNSTDANPSDGT